MVLSRKTATTLSPRRKVRFQSSHAILPMSMLSDRQIRLYQSGNGFYTFFNKINARDVGWSVIDVAFSPDQQSFVYSSWSTSRWYYCAVFPRTFTACIFSSSVFSPRWLRATGTSVPCEYWSQVLHILCRVLLGWAGDFRRRQRWLSLYLWQAKARKDA